MASPDEPTSADRRRAAAQVLLDVDAVDQLASEVISVPSDIEHHLTRVLRLREGEVVSVTDGRGGWRMAAWRPAVGELEATSTVGFEERTAPFTLATAIPKGDRVDLLVQKAAELGVARIVLLHADRSVVRWKPARADKQRGRLERVADEAVRQSRRVWRVVVEGAISADGFLGDGAVAEPGGAPLTASDHVVAVGPEGGWSDRELALAARTVTLGDAVLRVETAGIAACALSMAFRH